MQKTVAKINLKAIKDNARIFKDLTNVKLCAVVKANAYGHGAVETVNALEQIADFFAVALIEEALEIRQAACGKDVLVLTPPTNADEVRCFLGNPFIATVGDLSTAKLVERVARFSRKPIKVHLKVNTGMNRYGMGLKELGKVCTLFKGAEFVCVTGAFSHLYSGEIKTSLAQRELFVRAKNICERYFQGLTFHLSATYGCLLGEDFYFDAVRVGLGLYGYLPNGCELPLGVKSATDLRLKRAMSVYAKIVSSKKYSFGGLGYGKALSGQVEKGKKLHILRVGYADGFLRQKQNGMDGVNENASQLCMDACVRFGKKLRGRYACVLSDADKTAAETGTIAYEVLCKATMRASFDFLYE